MEDLSELKKENRSFKSKMMILLILDLIISSIIFLSSKSFIKAGIFFASIIILFFVYDIINKKLKEAAKIKKMEQVFPDFLQLVASNLRAGMTIDRALMLSARKEFAPLDKEINSVGKEIVTGKELNASLIRMSERINSEKISKTISLIITSIRSGGDLAILLEQISANIRKRDFIEKRASSNVLMYVIFIFFAVAFGAPILFGLSSILVEIMTGILSNLPETNTNINLPISFSAITISSTFLIYYSVIFLIMMGILASLILGLVSKGKEREGIKYIIPILAINISLFFIVRKVLLGIFSKFF